MKKKKTNVVSLTRLISDAIESPNMAVFEYIQLHEPISAEGLLSIRAFKEKYKLNAKQVNVIIRDFIKKGILVESWQSQRNEKQYAISAWNKYAIALAKAQLFYLLVLCEADEQETRKIECTNCKTVVWSGAAYMKHKCPPKKKQSK